MPEISRFYGIAIRMYYDEHLPPHFDAGYGEHQAVVAVRTLGIVALRLPSRALGLVIKWASLHHDELLAEWRKAANLQPLGKIAPLT
jgi:hypothetical protein